MPNKFALLMIDVQLNMFDEEMPVFNADNILKTLAEIAEQGRGQNVPVIYVRNNGGAGDPDERHSPGWEIHPDLTPEPDDWILDKTTPDTFASTDLQARLVNHNIDTLVIGGMQTEMCVNATINGALSRNYEVILISDGHTTFDFPDEPPAAEIIAGLNAQTSAKVLPANEITFG